MNVYYGLAQGLRFHLGMVIILLLVYSLVSYQIFFGFTFRMPDWLQRVLETRPGKFFQKYFPLLDLLPLTSIVCYDCRVARRWLKSVAYRKKGVDMNKAFPVVLMLMLMLMLMLIFVPGRVSAGAYTVVKVIGTVTADGVPVVEWAELSLDARLVFGDENAALRVLDGRKTFTLSGKRIERSSPTGELTAFLKDTFDPVSPVKRASVRGVITTKQDLRTFLSASTDPDQPKPFLVIGAGRYHIPPDVFRLDGGHLFLHYRYQDEKIEKRLPSLPGNGFEISPDIFVLDKGTSHEVQVDSSRITGGITVHYAIDDKSDEKVCGFQPVFVSPADLKRELAPLVRGWRGIGAGTGEIQSAVGQYLVENYGEPGDEAVAAWVESWFGLR